MITLFLLLLPLFGIASLLLVRPVAIKNAALVTSLLVFILSVFAWIESNGTLSTQYIFNYPWVASMGISFHIGMDGLSLFMVLLTTFLTPLIILSTFQREFKNPVAFYSLILLMQAALIGIFVARDAFLFYVFWELALIPIYFISLLWGGDNRKAVTLKFFIYTLAGSLLMLFAIIFLYYQTPGTHSFDLNAFYSVNLDSTTQGWIFWALFLAFAIKMPVFPFHTWQPSTYRENSTPGTMLLAGIMLKMGIFGVLRWLLPVVPEGADQWGNVAIILSVIGIIYASCIAIIQKDFKNLLAYSSIAHVGLISAGIFSFTEDGLRGGIFQMMSHGINVVGLFFAADIIYHRTSTFEMAQLGGIRSKAPVFSTFFMIILLGSIALPLTNGFVGEFLLLLGIFQYNNVIAGFAGLTIIFGAVYMLLAFQKMMLGETNSKTLNFQDLTFSEKAVLLPLSAAIIIMGCYPEPLIVLIEPTVQNLLIIINNTGKI